MTQPISLLFGVHAHQPVGNFDSVMEEAHVRCYRMFLQTAERYPAFRFAVHFSGWLLDWLMVRYPQDMARLAAMTSRGWVSDVTLALYQPCCRCTPGPPARRCST